MNELQHQIALMSWARKTGDPRLDLLFHIPNGGFRRKQEAALLKASGVRSGVPDLCLPSNGGCLWIELKAPDGRASMAQSHWIGRLSQLSGHKCFVAYGWREAVQAIEAYLGASYDVDLDAIEARM